MNTFATEPDLPLHALFMQLRQAGLPLGIDEYQGLLLALQGGFGIRDSATLARICKILWAKSAEDAHLFDYHFAQVMSSFAAPESPALPEQPSRNSEETKLDTPLSHPPITPESEQANNPSLVTPPVSGQSTSSPSMTTEMIVELQDEVQIAQALLHSTDEASYFISSDEYFPITRRQMKQSWRYLRRPVRQGPSVEIDIGATVDIVGRQGVLLEPVLVPRRVNLVELFLFLDQGGSMLPFHLLSQRLAETAMRGGRLERTKTYFFHNCPVEYLYHDPTQLSAIPLQEVIDSLHFRRTSILIFSDAGAARGALSQERVEMTADFLYQLKQRVQHVVWLNPMPRLRWPQTTAGKILTHVPMFDLSRRGLDDAISTLLGRSVSYPQREDDL
jgi:uncharacterized protein